MTFGDDLLVFSILYDRVSSEDYASIEDESVWKAFSADCREWLPEGEITEDLIVEAPSYEEYRSFCNAVLTPGIPGSVVPVESFYRPWSDLLPTGMGASTGYYLSDHARHIEALCEQLEITVPERFAAMPDHLSVLLEILMFLQFNAPESSSRDFIEDHFDWLGEYRAALSERWQKEDDERLARTMLFYIQLTDLLMEALHTRTRGEGIEHE